MNPSTSISRRLKTWVKQRLWERYSEADGMRDVTVLSGPCRGVRLRIDFRDESAYWLGTYDRKILRLLGEILQPGQVAFDCGAYLGIYAAAMRRRVGSGGTVHVFEASGRNFRRVSLLPARNGWTNVTVHYLAVGEAHSTIRFASNLGAASGPVDMPGKQLDMGNVQVETVACSGIDELVGERGLPDPDFLKLDLETAECFALKNGAALWTRKRPRVLVELHRNRRERPYAFEAAEEFLRAFDYCGTEVHLGQVVKSVDDFLKAEEAGVQCTILALPR
jgi:FkbM family methyltransferase